MFRIAPLSALHVLLHTSASWRAAIFNKRLTGCANLFLRCGRVHPRGVLEAVVAPASNRADHVVVTLHASASCTFATALGSADVVARGAALDHPSRHVRAGFNLYEIDDNGAAASIGSGCDLQRVTIDSRAGCT